MIFIETPLKGAFIIELEQIKDIRGFFARSFCRHEFINHGLDPFVSQCNISFNERKFTLRGMHYNVPPHEEAKLVICYSGAIYDVIIDLRPQSATFCRWYGINLSPNGSMLYIPRGLAHGFQTLEDNTTVFYQMSEAYHPECARGVRWNDPRFAIPWPNPTPIISDRDKQYPDF